MMQLSNTKPSAFCDNSTAIYTHRGEIIYHISQVIHNINIAFQLPIARCKLLGIKCIKFLKNILKK